MKMQSSTYQTYLNATLSDNTRRAYDADLRHFTAWGGRVPASADTLSRYLSDHAARMKVATLERHVAAISQAHAKRGLSNPATTPLVKAILRGIRRQHGANQRQAKPLTVAALKKLVCPLAQYSELQNLRDRALLLIGFSGAFRRSELVGLTYADVEPNRHGLVLYLRASKTDAACAGRRIAIPHGRGRLCPVKALKAWMVAADVDHAENDNAAIFRRIDRHGAIGSDALSGAAVNLILKNRMAAAGLDTEGFSAHSLRAGLVTAAALAGVPTWQIQRQTGHKTEQMVTRYIRSVGLFDGNAAHAVL